MKISLTNVIDKLVTFPLTRGAIELIGRTHLFREKKIYLPISEPSFKRLLIH